MRQAEYLLLRLSAAVQLRDAERRALRHLDARRIAAPAGRDLVIEGQCLDHAVIFERGWGCSYTLLEDGRRQILQILLPGDQVGDPGAVFARADHTVATLTPSRVLLVPIAALTEAARRHPRLALALEWSRCRERSIMQTRLVDLGRRSACQRTAHLMLELHRRLELVGLAGADCFPLPLTQETMADALGLTMVHVNRTLRQLRADGLVGLDHGRMTILERERLVDLAGFDEAYLHHAPASRSAIARLPEADEDTPAAPVPASDAG